uniref:Protein asunder n=1 Tax=Rhabditophanes sp. KR3021 TaxID=114890 RepID=A0AC35TFQ2_9BILA
MPLPKDVESWTHKSILIVQKTHKFLKVFPKTSTFCLDVDGQQCSIPWERTYWSYIKEFILEYQRITTDLYGPGIKQGRVITFDKTSSKVTPPWSAGHINYDDFYGGIGGSLITDQSECDIDKIGRSVGEAIEDLGQLSPLQLDVLGKWKAIERAKENSESVAYVGKDNTKKSVKWWVNSQLNHTKSEPKTLRNNATIVIIAADCDDSSAKTLLEETRLQKTQFNKLLLQQPKPDKSKIDGLRIVLINFITTPSASTESFIKIEDELDDESILFDRFDIFEQTNFRKTCNDLLVEIYGLSSLILKNIPMKDEANKAKLTVSVEILHPRCDIPYLGLPRYQDEDVFQLKEEVPIEESNPPQPTPKHFSHSSNIVAWGLPPKKTPTFVQSLPYTIADFTSREGMCASAYILHNNNNCFPEIFQLQPLDKGIEIAFAFAKGMDDEQLQLNVLDKHFYDTMLNIDIGKSAVKNAELCGRMFEVIEENMSNFEYSANSKPSYHIDFKKKRSFKGGFRSTGGEDVCFRTKLSQAHTFLGMKTLVKSTVTHRNRRMLDIISNFRFATPDHAAFFNAFVNRYFKKFVQAQAEDTQTTSPSNSGGSKILRSSKKSVFDMLLPKYKMLKLEFGAWSKSESVNENQTVLYKNLQNSKEIEKNRPIFDSRYYAVDPDDVLLRENNRYAPNYDSYPPIAPPPYWTCGPPLKINETAQYMYRDLVYFMTDVAYNPNKKVHREAIEEKMGKLKYMSNRNIQNQLNKPRDNRKRKLTFDLPCGKKMKLEVCNEDKDEATNNSTIVDLKTFEQLREQFKRAGQIPSYSSIKEKLKPLLADRSNCPLIKNSFFEGDQIFKDMLKEEEIKKAFCHYL